MSARKKAESKEEPAAAPAETQEPTPASPKSTAVGGLAELQADADETAAKGYLGSKEKTE